MKANFDRPKCG